MLVDTMGERCFLRCFIVIDVRLDNADMHREVD